MNELEAILFTWNLVCCCVGGWVIGGRAGRWIAEWV